MHGYTAAVSVFDLLYKVHCQLSRRAQKMILQRFIYYNPLLLTQYLLLHFYVTVFICILEEGGWDSFQM